MQEVRNVGRIVEMDGKGRIVIPKTIRERLGLLDGSKIIVESADGESSWKWLGQVIFRPKRHKLRANQMK